MVRASRLARRSTWASSREARSGLLKAMRGDCSTWVSTSASPAMPQICESTSLRANKPTTILRDRQLRDLLWRLLNAGIEFADLVAPAVEARPGLAREQIGAAQGCGRVLGHDAIELVGLARVLARNAV